MQKLTEPRFTADQFTATQWDSAADKAKFANHFLRFIMQGCPRTTFHKWFYNRLSNTFGHIAHYDQWTFYSVFFTTKQDRFKFMRHTMTYPCYGQPEFTYCDVERALQERLREHKVLEQWQRAYATETEKRERELLAQLKQKYPEPETAAA